MSPLTNAVITGVPGGGVRSKVRERDAQKARRERAERMTRAWVPQPSHLQHRISESGFFRKGNCPNSQFLL